MKPYQDYTGDFMQLMKDWYVQSNELIHFMIESFSFQPAGIQFDGEGDKPSSDNSRENIWTGYIKNLDRLLKELGSNFGFNQKLWENVNTSWKEFQNSMNEYMKPFSDPDKHGGIPEEVWAKWLEYASSMNSQLLNSYYYLYRRKPQAGNGQDSEPQAGKFLFPGSSFIDTSNMDPESINEMDEIFKKYYTEISKELMVASEAVLFKNEGTSEKSQEFIAKWSDLYNSFVKELISTPGYNKILNENLQSGLKARKQLDDAFESHWKLLGLPTRTDVMELHRELHDLQLKLNRLSKHIDRLEARPPSKRGK